MNRTYERTGFGGVFAVFVLACVVSTILHGCGASALQRQSAAARITRTALNITADGIETACSAERVEYSSDPQRVAQRCLRAVEGHDAAVAAWSGWVSALILAEGNDDALSRAVSMALPILRFYQETAELLRAMGVNAPDLPQMVLDLLPEVEQ